MRQKERAERRDMGRGREWMKEKEVMRVVGRIFVSSKKKKIQLFQRLMESPVLPENMNSKTVCLIEKWTIGKGKVN